MSSRSTGSASRLLLAVVLLLATAGAAEAKKRVAVAPFAGRGAESVHDEVEELIQSDNTLVSQSAYVRATKRVRLKRNDAAFARIASELQLDAIIEGSLARRRGRGGGWNLGIVVRDGSTGAVSDRFSVRLRKPRLDAREKGELAEKLLPALGAVGAIGTSEPVEITPPAKPDEVDSEQPLAPKAPEPVETVRSDEGEVRAATADEMVAHRYNRHAAIDVQAGMTAGWRNLRFTFADDLPNNMKPNGYKGSVVPSVLVAGEVYPLAFGGSSGALSGLGISFVFDRVILLKSKLGTTEYDTSQTRYGAGLRYRWAFGHKATLPTLKFIAGWNHLDFTIDRGTTDLDLPNVKYSYVDLGLALRVPLGNPNYAIYADGRYMVVLSSGEIQEQGFYGDGGTLGIDGDIGIEAIFARRVILKVGGRYQRIAFDFDGTGDRSKNRDGDPMTQDVGGALDQYFSAYATVGYLF